MEFSATRKILVVIFSVIIAFSTAITISALITNSTIASDSYIVKNMVTSAVTAECEAQLSAKYTVLEAQSGIPKTVFETVKNEYPISDSLTKAFQNVSGSESSELYTDDLVDYFDTLCTEYLDGNSMKYQKEYIHNTSEKAAEIFSETVGVRNLQTLRDRVNEVKDFTLTLIVIAMLSAIVAGLTMSFTFSNKQRAYVCILSGISGGAAGTALGALICRLIHPFASFIILPEIYKSAFISMTDKYFLFVAAASAVISVAAWLSMFLTNKRIRKKD